MIENAQIRDKLSFLEGMGLVDPQQQQLMMGSFGTPGGAGMASFSSPASGGDGGTPQPTDSPPFANPASAFAELQQLRRENAMLHEKLADGGDRVTPAAALNPPLGHSTIANRPMSNELNVGPAPGGPVRVTSNNNLQVAGRGHQGKPRSPGPGYTGNGRGAGPGAGPNQPMPPHLGSMRAGNLPGTMSGSFSVQRGPPGGMASFSGPQGGGPGGVASFSGPQGGGPGGVASFSGPQGGGAPPPPGAPPHFNPNIPGNMSGSFSGPGGGMMGSFQGGYTSVMGGSDPSGPGSTGGPGGAGATADGEPRNPVSGRNALSQTRMVDN
eukprot:gene4751-34500_t